MKRVMSSSTGRPILSQKLKVALIQMHAGHDKTKNLKTAKDNIEKAVSKGAELVVLPECFNSPYAVKSFPKYAEHIPEGETTKLLSEIAKASSIYIVGGSIPEKQGGKIYNTSLTFNPSGDLIAKHRKVHLFDIDIPDKIRFVESDVLSAGDKATLVDLPPYGSVGIGICYDIRFPELASIAARKGAFAMVYPGAFNTTTGPLHWHLLARARAVDNQIYVIACSPSRDLSSGYHAFGHSLVVNPSGVVIAEAGEKDEILYATLDGDVIEQFRVAVPITKQRRFDVYHDVSIGAKVSSI